MVIQVMPPTLEANLLRPEWHETLTSALRGLTGKKLTEAHSTLGDLTFLETAQLVARLQSDVDDVSEEIADAGRRGTMGSQSGRQALESTIG